MPGYIRYRGDLKPRARSMRSEGTPMERKLWFEFLRSAPAKFTRQKPLGRYVVDFYCSQHRLAIELDGDSHYTASGASRDATRTAWLLAQGIHVLRFTNADVMQDFEGVCAKVLGALR